MVRTSRINCGALLRGAALGRASGRARGGAGGAFVALSAQAHRETAWENGREFLGADLTAIERREQAFAGQRAEREAKKAADREAEAAAHEIVDKVKQALGERGPVWVG